MGSLKQTKQRIYSVKNTKKITKTMQIISAIKFQKAYDDLMSLNEFTKNFERIAKEIKNNNVVFIDQIFLDEQVTNFEKYHLIMIFSSDKGLSGSYLSNIKKTLINSNLETFEKCKVILVGKKLLKFVKKYFPNIDIIKSFSLYTNNELLQLSNVIFEYLYNIIHNDSCYKVTLIYTNVKSLSDQLIVHKVIFEKHTKSNNQFDNTVKETEFFDANFDTNKNSDFVIDVDKTELARYIFFEQIRLEITNAIANSLVADNLNRMLAMKKATESSQEIIDLLNLEYNKQRQAMVTKEIIEIISGMDSTSGVKQKFNNKHILKLKLQV